MDSVKRVVGQIERKIGGFMLQMNQIIELAVEKLRKYRLCACSGMVEDGNNGGRGDRPRLHVGHRQTKRHSAEQAGIRWEIGI